MLTLHAPVCSYGRMKTKQIAMLGTKRLTVRVDAKEWAEARDAIMEDCGPIQFKLSNNQIAMIVLHTALQSLRKNPARKHKRN